MSRSMTGAYGRPFVVQEGMRLQARQQAGKRKENSDGKRRRQ
jgi:hypothetical protein